jgi:uncharacterized protein (DUF1684 family)
MNRLAVAAVLLLTFACRQEKAVVTETGEPRPVTQTATSGVNHDVETVEAWKARRLKSLQSEEGWLSLVGLHWLKEGENRFGSLPSNDVVLPATAPETAGTLTLAGGKVTLTPAAPMAIEGNAVSGATALANDNEDDGPTVVQMGTMRFQVIKRNERIGLRVKDAEAPTRTNFAGLDYFPVEPKWRLEARFEPYDPPKQIAIADVTGSIQHSISPGALVFSVEGEEYRLDPILEDGSPNLFVIFRDQTSADSTYPAGRYVYTAPAGDDGKVILDFNKAYNPPCAFTEFATCPLPPPQNRLPFRIEAGEKKYGDGH